MVPGCKSYSEVIMQARNNQINSSILSPDENQNLEEEVSPAWLIVLH